MSIAARDARPHLGFVLGFKENLRPSLKAKLQSTRRTKESLADFTFAERCAIPEIFGKVGLLVNID